MQNNLDSQVNESKIDLIKTLSSKLAITPVLAKLLLDRGIDNLDLAQDFLNPRLANLPNPKNIPNIYEIARFVSTYVKTNKKICVYGDYDLDGISSTALLYSFLEECGANVMYYIPDRINDGYALSTKTLDYLKEQGVELIITVDCGITNVKEALYAKKIGIELVITDHHEAQDIKPDAFIVNPKLNTENTELLMLAGVGVAFYFTIVLKSVLKDLIPDKIEQIDVKKYLWLVAIGSIADIVPLLGVNRILVYYGLNQINKGKILAINVLAEKDTRIKIGSIDSTTISFLFAPKLNAAGRIASPLPVLELFLSKNIEQTREIVNVLDGYNKKRVELQKMAIKKLREDLLDTNDITGIPLFYHEEFHQGVIGIVASRFSKELKRPVVICADDGDGVIKCSSRSYNDVNLLEIIKLVEDELIAFGGHKAAAGFACKKDKLKKIKNIISEYDYKKYENKSKKSYFEVNLQDLTPQLADEILLLEPFGNGNRKPSFALKNTKIKNKRVLKDKHLKFKLSNNIDVIGFNLYSEDNFSKDDASLIFCLEFNLWNGIKRLQLNLLEME